MYLLSVKSTINHFSNAMYLLGDLNVTF